MLIHEMLLRSYHTAWPHNSHKANCLACAEPVFPHQVGTDEHTSAPQSRFTVDSNGPTCLDNNFGPADELFQDLLGWIGSIVKIQVQVRNARILEDGLVVEGIIESHDELDIALFEVAYGVCKDLWEPVGPNCT